MNLAFGIASIVFACALFALLAISNGKKKWYKVYLANPEMTETYYRTGWDKFWRGDEAGIMVFHTVDGKSVRIGKHWIIKIVEQ